MKMKQVATSLPPYLETKLRKVAKIEKRSVSGLVAEAIAVYLDRWIAETREATIPKKSLFTGLDKNDAIRAIQKQA